MKRVLPLILATVLMLSLAACGGNNSMTKEEMVETATELNCSLLQTSYSENTVNAEETYVGNIYQITGYVTEIQEESVRLIPLNAPLDVFGKGEIEIEAYLSLDEIKELSTNEVINLVGEVSEITGSSDFTIYVTMDNAYFVDNIIEITGEVDSFLLDSTGNQYIMWVDELMSPSVGVGMYRYECPIGPVTGSETFEDADIDGVTVTEGEKVTISGVLTLDYSNYYSDIGVGEVYLVFDEVNSISKSSS